MTSRKAEFLLLRHTNVGLPNSDVQNYVILFFPIIIYFFLEAPTDTVANIRPPLASSFLGCL